jgi:HEPN domain-containing protein
LLIARKTAFPRTHVLEFLLDLLKGAGVKVPGAVDECYRLTQYAVETRYPGWSDPVSKDEYREALDMARRAVRWVEELLGEEEP